MSKLRKSSKQKLYAGCIGAGIVGIIFAGYLMVNIHQMNEVRKQAEVEAELKWKVYEQEQRTAKKAGRLSVIFLQVNRLHLMI